MWLKIVQLLVFYDMMFLSGLGFAKIFHGAEVASFVALTTALSTLIGGFMLGKILSEMDAGKWQEVVGKIN